MSTQRCTVFGAGILGLSIAWSLLRRGVSVDVVDPHGPGAGASGGIVGALAPHVPENWNEKKAFQFASLDRGAVFWAEVADVSGRDPGYARSGRLQPILDVADLDLAMARSKTAETLWQGRYRWQVVAADDWGVASPTGKLIHDDLTARIHPRQATTALAEAVRRLGGRITQTAPEDCALQVWATGAAGLDALSASLGRNIGTGVKGQAALLDCDLRDQPQVFVDALHIVPHGDGTVAIGSTTERNYADPQTTDAALEAVIARARTALPVLAQAKVLERWAGLRPRARSRAPLLGPHPGRHNVFIANGGFKIGFGMAPEIGAVMADLILDGRDRIPESFGFAANL
ncbi:MAG: FAD-binding oxidoreductase [Pseudomonadota bacterium]